MTAIPLSLIQLEHDRDIATIRVNRPQHLNSVNPAAICQLQQAFDEVADDPAVCGIVFGGQGKAFVVGAELSFFLRNIKSNDLKRIVQYTEAGHRLMNTIDACPKPVVAAVGGVALGAGVEIALACDCIVASPRASFGLPETGLGIYPGFGGTQRTPRKVGVGLAKWLIYAGKTLSTIEAKRIGLVDEVVDHDELETVARRHIHTGTACRAEREPLSPELSAIEHFFETNPVERLRRGEADTGGNRVLVRAMKPVATKGPVALRLAERLIDQGMSRTLAEGLQLEIDHVLDIFRTEDALRGLSFRANRQVGHPEFLGR